MKRGKEKMSRLFTRSKEMIEAAMTDDDIKQAISKYNIDNNALNEGKTILAAVDRLVKKCTQAADEQKEQAVMLRIIRKNARILLAEHLTLTELALRDNSGKMNKLFGRNKADRRRTKEWFLQMEQFYSYAVTDEDLLQELGRYGITADRLKEGHESIRKLDSARENYNRLKRKTRDLATERSEAVKNLRKWLSTFIVVCRIALKENQQLLEKLGIQVFPMGYYRGKNNPNQAARAIE